MGILNWRFAQLCKIPTDMFYRACTILASEFSEFWEHVICGKSNQIIPFWIWTFVWKGQSFWLQTKLIFYHLGHPQQQFINLRIWNSLYLLTHLWIEISCALIPWIWHYVKGVIIHAIVIPLWNLNLLDPLLACCLKSLIIDIMIYISTDPLNWWCYFLSRRQYVAWCAKIDHLVLTFPHWLLHMLYWRSRIILCLICSSSLSLFRWTLNCLDITTTS
jgi:hypothetical protein